MKTVNKTERSVSIIRRTGLPVELQDIKTFTDKFRMLFDKAERILKKEAAKIGNKNPDMLKMQGRIAKIHHVLSKKYPTVQTVELPSSTQDWLDLQAKYGNILVTRMIEKEEVILVIEDQEAAQY